ncbi:blastula protease 10-like [Patiria miniata]|uniref:Metalloendopeptidase n=1 Tax=Patiria miniata TaxID=46514 RepID=A0A914BJK8_PATMI|nr:blastula protease 10-like [Patiria miniata]
MKLCVLLGAVLAVCHLVAGRSKDYRMAKGKVLQELHGTGSVRPEPAEEIDDTVGAFQSDMLLTPKQMQEVMELIEEGKSGVDKRKAVAYLSYRWPQNMVPYEFDSSSEADRDAIMAGMSLWSEESCVQFVPYSAQVASSLGHENRIQFYKGSGCSSYVGMIGAGAQQVSIGNGCTGAGTIAHEIGHALGWHHEQSRPDRDEAVTINYDNVQPGREINFAKYSTAQISTHDVPYDISSIMHYGSGYFSANGEPTIVALDPVDQFLMGNRADFSFYDMKLANIMFGCSDHCNTNLQCQNEGYIGKDCTCVCKPGYSGTHCESFNPDSLGCIRKMTALTGTLESSGYPAQYQNNAVCAWQIMGGAGSTISLSFEAFSLETDATCRYDKLTVRAGTDISTGGQVFCGTTIPPEIESVGNQMLVIFSSDNIITAPGFQANYVIHGNTVATNAPPPPFPAITTKQPAVATTRAPTNCEVIPGTCGGTYGNAGCIASPNYGEGTYNSDEECIYNIETRTKLLSDR